MRKKILLGILAAAVICGVFALTFQSSEGTVRLSETVRKALESIGWKMESHALRSNIHIVMYFVLGITIALFGRSMGWKPWMTILIGCGIGLLDETVKVLLPGREFELVDLIKDCVGVVLGNSVWLFNRDPDEPD